MTIIIKPTGPMPAEFTPACIDPPYFSRPLAVSHLPAGFPSPAADSIESSLDLNEYLVANDIATFFFTVKGDSMTGAGIMHGDKACVDRSLDARHMNIVVASVNGDLTCKYLWKRGRVVELRSANPAYPPIQFEENEEMICWGVVNGVARKVPV